MSLKQFVSKSMHGLRVSLAALTVLQLSLGGPFAGPLQAQPNTLRELPSNTLSS